MQRQQVERLTLDFVETIESAEAVSDATRIFQTYIEGLGFSSATCLKVPEAGEDKETCLLMSSFPQAWVDHYAERGYVRKDPVVRELFHRYQPYTWSEVLQRREITAEEQMIFREASAFGLNEGFLVPIYETTGYTGLVSIAGQAGEVKEDVRNALTLSSIYLHNKLSALRRSQSALQYELTEREMDCLSWAAAGKSDWEIGQILTISAKTVNYHIENSKRKFGVATRVQAIVAALRNGKLVH